MKQFVNLHNHTVGSLLDGASKPEEYIERAIELGQPAVATTDHGNVYTLIDMYTAAQKAGIKYIPGIEAYMSRKTRFDRDPEEKAGKTSAEWQQRGPYHQTILAVNNAGYHNLLKLSSRAFTEGFYVKPRMDYELIGEHSEGLVVTSGCLSGPVQQALLRGDYNAAVEHAAIMQDLVGKDNYFIEIMNHQIPEELSVHADLQRIAKKIDAPIVATNDSHYTHRENSVAHDHLLCTNTRSLRSNPDRFKFYNDSFYLKSYDEMTEMFPEEWVDNTMRIYDKLDLSLDFDSQHYPVYDIPESSPIKVIPDYFVNRIGEGAAKRFGDDWQTERRDVADILNHEIGVIKEMGYESYFLIVADIIKWCRDNGILIGPGRGSSASSVVAYCLEITHVDPIEYDLLFERFLTPGRVPDIDIDIDDRHRDKALAHIRNTFGQDKTAQIITIGKMKAKSAIKDVCRVSGKPFDYAQTIVDAMPPAQFGVTKTLDECMQAEEFKRLYDSDQEIKKIIDTAIELEGVWRSDGIHAGGIIVADSPITDHCPVQQKGDGEPIVTQWDMRTAERIGLLKIDMLGLKNLGIIQDTIVRVKNNHGIDIGDPYELARNPSQEVFDYLSEGNTAQVFQMGSDGLTSMVKAMGIDSVKDIMAALALYRPGPMDSGFHHAYAKRKRGLQKPVPLHPLLKDILAPTQGLLLYQEQILYMAKEIAGFGPTAANKLLKSIGKKDREVMAAAKDSFISGCVDHSGITEEEAGDLFAAVEPHADYSFSSAHAAAYAYISYITAYLKYYYPAEYSASCLTSVMFGAEEKFRPVLNDVKDKIGVNVLPPSVNHSQFDFNAIDGDVIFSISGLKGVGEAKSSSFVKHRDESGKNYSSIYNLFQNSEISVLDKTFFEALIYSGSLDELVKDELVEDTQIDVELHLKLLLGEMSVLGISVTQNPFDIYFESIEFDTPTFPVTNLLDMPRSSERHCGIVKDPEIKVSKAGRRYAKFYLDDGVDQIECLILGKSVTQIEDQLSSTLEETLTAGAFISFYGKINLKEDECSIYINEIFDRYTPEILGDKINSISVLLSDYSRKADMEKLLSGSPGTHKVYLCFSHPNAKLTIREESEFRVNDSMVEYLKQFELER